jgi:D-alanyl-D-alanine carboxypeptidase/D-alanyl-D-alanine-endopeptidase (penicillin-binding protein 4)
LAALAERFLADPAVVGHPSGLSVWVEGRGEVLAVGAERAQQPASVQKLATAAAALERLDPAFRFTTVVTTTAPISPDGRVGGDVVLVGGGDPTLGRTGPHSLAALAAQVRAAGVRQIDGRLLVDTSRWSADRAAPGWLDWHQPRFIGWLSALLADQNRWQTGDATLDPGLANARWFAGSLAEHGVVVAGGVGRTAGPSLPAADGARVLATLSSAPRDELVRHLLLTSDNLVAEAFLLEVGHQADGVGGHAGGAAATTAVLGDLLGRPPGGAVADGSGLSRADLWSAGDWRRLLVAARDRPWWPVLESGLPVAATSGTLASRFGGTVAAGNLRAKTGTTVEARSLAGSYRGASGRLVVFAVVVNGTPSDGPIGAEHAIDRLLADLVSAT